MRSWEGYPSGRHGNGKGGTSGAMIQERHCHGKPALQRGTPRQREQRSGRACVEAADLVAIFNYYQVRTLKHDSCFPQHLQDAIGRAGRQRGLSPSGKPPSIDRMQPVHILLGRDRTDEAHGAEVAWHRERG